ncbi:hypothetical protein Tco_1514767 [Tanacetum coccineum]
MAKEEAVPKSLAPKATKVTKPKADVQTKPSTPKATKAIKYTGKVTKKRKPKSPLKLVDEFADEGVPISEPRIDDEEADNQKALPEVQGKGKEKVVDEQAAHDLLTLHIPKKMSPADQFIFQRRTPMPTEPSGHVESPSLDVELALTDSETESDKEVPEINAGNQDEGQAGPNPGEQDEGQAGSNPGDAAVSQPQSSHVVHAGPNLEHMDLEATDASTQQIPEQMDEDSTRTLSSLQNLEKELSFTDQFFMEKPQEEEPEKTNVESEVQSMVTVPIHQDTSSVPPMTTLVIDLTTLQANSLTVHALLPTSTSITTTITTTTLPPPSHQPQQSTTYPILIQRIGELEQHMANLIQDNSALEERLNKQGSRLYKLENLNIPHQVSIAVDEIVTDAVDWAMQAPLRACFSDLPAVDMKEILQQRMFKDKSYEAHKDHKNVFDALQKSLERDYSNQLLSDQEEARQKKRKRRDVPRTPSGSPPLQPPPLPPLSGASGAPGTLRASGSSQLPLPPPPLSTGTSGSVQQQGTGVSGAQELSPTNSLIHDDSIPDEQWKPLPAEERPATPEPAWTIPSSNMSDVENNWASTLVTTYETPAENSLFAKTGDMTTFMNWYYRRVNKTELTQANFKGQAYEVVKSFYPDVIHLQFQMEECHKMLTDQVDWTNPEGDQVRIDVNRPLPLGGPPGHVTILTQFFFNKDLEYLRYGNKGSSLALSISKMKAASYPDFGLKLLVPERMWIDDVCTYDISAKYGISHWWFNRLKFYIDRHDSLLRQKEVRSHMRILSVVRIKAYSRYVYDYLSEIVLRRADFQEHMIAEKDFKNLYPSDFKDLNLLLLQGHLDHLPGSDKRMLSTTVKLWT